MASTQRVKQLGDCLAGVFQNREQAMADPAWFVHIRLWSHPIPLFEADSITFLLEQASASFAQAPYRQRILRLRSLAGELTAEYYALKEPMAFQGATQNSEQLQQLTEDDLQPLSGSRLRVEVQLQPQGIRFAARHYPGEHCQFIFNGDVKWVALGFDAIAPQTPHEPAAFWMYDKGLDPKTGQMTWGAIHGPFQLTKVEDWSKRLIGALP
jgi:hypothetical protein